MKKYSFIYTLASALMMGVVALSGLTSCSSSDDAVADVKPEVKPETKYVYQVSIPAGFSGSEGTRAVTFNDNNTSTATFLTTEEVYAYLVTGSSGSEIYTLLGGKLQPASNGDPCTLVGTFTSPSPIQTNNVLILMYNMTNPGSSEDESYFNYDDNGNNYDHNVHDGATARVKVTVSGGGYYGGEHCG